MFVTFLIAPVEQPTDINYQPLSPTGLFITWSSSSDDYLYLITCTNLNITDSVSSYNIVTRNNSVLVANLLPTNHYNCCITAMMDDINGEPLCQVYVTQEDEDMTMVSSCASKQVL